MWGGGVRCGGVRCGGVGGGRRHPPSHGKWPSQRSPPPSTAKLKQTATYHIVVIILRVVLLLPHVLLLLTLPRGLLFSPAAACRPASRGRGGGGAAAAAAPRPALPLDKLVQNQINAACRGVGWPWVGGWVGGMAVGGWVGPGTRHTGRGAGKDRWWPRTAPAPSLTGPTTGRQARGTSLHQPTAPARTAPAGQETEQGVSLQTDCSVVPVL